DAVAVNIYAQSAVREDRVRQDQHRRGICKARDGDAAAAIKSNRIALAGVQPADPVKGGAYAVAGVTDGPCAGHVCADEIAFIYVLADAEDAFPMVAGDDVSASDDGALVCP